MDYSRISIFCGLSALYHYFPVNFQSGEADYQKVIKVHYELKAELINRKITPKKLITH